MSGWRQLGTITAHGVSLLNELPEIPKQIRLSLGDKFVKLGHADDELYLPESIVRRTEGGLEFCGKDTLNIPIQVDYFDEADSSEWGLACLANPEIAKIAETFPEKTWIYLDHETPYQDLAEVKRLAGLAPRRSGTDNLKVVVEIGSWTGCSAWAIMQEPSVDWLFCVDHWQGSPDRISDAGHSPQVVRDAFCKNMLEYILARRLFVHGPMSSKQAAEMQWLSVSMVYIDANHEECWQDIQLWLPHLLPGGIICGHDFGEFPSVDRDVRRLTKTMEVTVVGHVWSARKP